MGEMLAISGSSSLVPQFRFNILNRGGHLLPRRQASAAAPTDCTSVCFLRTRSDPVVLTWTLHSQSQQQKGFLDSKAPTIFTVDSAAEGIETLPDTSGGGDDFGSSGGGGGGSGGDNNNNDGGEGGSEDSKDKSKKMAMSMSQKLTLGYAALVGVGGLMGYLKSGSQKSLLSGGLSALLLYYVYTQLPTNTFLASSIGLGLSAALLGVMGSRFKKSGKIFPAGVVSFVSLVMTGGYLHGILRTLH